MRPTADWLAQVKKVHALSLGLTVCQINRARFPSPEDRPRSRRIRRNRAGDAVRGPVRAPDRRA